jgi:hypothetical protein
MILKSAGLRQGLKGGFGHAPLGGRECLAPPLGARSIYELRLMGINAMARPEGLEPPTTGLEGRCSILLSYGRTNEVDGLARPTASRTL